MASSPKRARSAAAYIRLCDGFGHNAEHLIYPFIKAKESVQIMFKHQEESLIDALCRAEILLRPPPEMNCFDGNIFIENEPFAKWSEETLKRYRDRVNMELQKCNINNVMIDQVKEQSSLSQPMITGTGKSFLLNLLLLLTSESYRTSRKIKLPKDITGNPTIEIVKEEHFEDLPEVIKDFLDDITEDQQDFKSVMEPVCHELIFSSEMVLSEEMKKYIFSTTVLPVLHCSIHAMEGDPHGILEENKHFLENTGIYALIRELDQLTLKRKSVVIEEIENKFVEFEKYNMDKENENIRMDEETENRQLDEDCEISQMDEESEISQKDDKSQGENIGSASKSFIFKNETDFLKINEDLFEKLKNQNGSLIEKTLNEQLKITMEKVAEPAKANLVTIRNSVTETRFFNPQYSGRHSCFKMNLYSQLFGHLDEEISIIFHDLIKKMRNYLDEYKQNAITLFTEELRDKKKLRTATVGNSLQCALGWYMGKTRSSFNEDNLVKTFKDLLTESMRKHILQPAYNKTTANTRLTEGEVAAQIEIVLLDVQSSFKKHIFSLYNEKWPANLARFMMRSYLPVTSISRPGCTFCGELKCTICIYIVHSDKFTSRAKKVYTVKEHLQCTTSNAIYLITCRRCSMQYVGQTSMTVRRRFIDHLSTINCKKDLSVSRHFNLPDHSRQDISLMVIDKVENSCSLLKREEYWIRELNTLQPNGLNATQ
ncbi:uncharacterized protein [Phyllobates terribilis]|uniref:uncharacterized protein isoform X2 n=1 Tax=Phyllobates terribilis TaxID=111132 RepID=UPI003CCABE60